MSPLSLSALPVASFAAAVTVVAESAIDSGLNPATGWAGGLVAGGLAVYLYLDRRARATADAVDLDRRTADTYRLEEIARLQRRVDELTQMLIDHHERNPHHE